MKRREAKDVPRVDLLRHHRGHLGLHVFLLRGEFTVHLSPFNTPIIYAFCIYTLYVHLYKQGNKR